MKDLNSCCDSLRNYNAQLKVLKAILPNPTSEQLNEYSGKNPSFGVFIIPYNVQYFLFITAFNGFPNPDWEHVSVQRINFSDYILQGNLVEFPKCPSWDEMKLVKDLFFDEEERVVQFHPPKSEYVNSMEYMLHLWKHKTEDFPHPPPEIV